MKMGDGGIITLTTDFGTRDTYVAQMKGAILTHAPNAEIVDVTHDIPPGNIWRAAYFLRCILDRFPEHTTHVIIVDPTVGTHRSILLGETDDAFILCPDNGILTFVLDRCIRISAVSLPDTMTRHASRTFHGRDLFAPLAGRLAGGHDFAAMLKPAGDPILLPYSPPSAHAEGQTGTILHVDRFGNIITDLIPESRLTEVTLLLGDQKIHHVADTFSRGPEGLPFLYRGSSNTIEIAVKNGRAADHLPSEPGTKIILMRNPSKE